MTEATKVKMKELTCGRVRGNRASEIVCNLLRNRYGKVSRIAVDYEDTTGIYLIVLEGKSFAKEKVREILSYLDGVLETLCNLDVTTRCWVKFENERGCVRNA
jgi:tRNA U38,U39,U40 pseudouridine synthase TruA